MLFPVMRRRTWMRSGLALALIAGGGGAACAEKLDKESCKSLSVERDSLVAAGVNGDMDRGPEWAKTNLAPGRLGEIKRMIELGEQLEFRCGSGAGSGTRLAKRSDFDDEAGGKQSATPKHGKHEPASPSKTSTEVKPQQTEGSGDSADKKPTTVPRPAPLALPAAPMAPHSRSALGAAKLEPVASTSKPVVEGGAHKLAETAPAPAATVANPVKTITPEEAAAKLAPQSHGKPSAETAKQAFPEAPPSLGKATLEKETSEAPTLGKAQPDPHSRPGQQDAASEDLGAPSLGSAAAPEATSTIQGLGTAAAPAAALGAASLGKAGPPTTTGAAGGKKAARRKTTARGYVSPEDVNAGSLSRYGAAP
jgi:hypothetical protein